MRYFIDYEEYIKIKEQTDNLLNEDKINLIKKTKDKTYIIEPILYFNDYKNDILNNSTIIKNNKKGIYLMVELNKNELKDYNPLLIKTFNKKNSRYELVENEIKLINYNTYLNLNSKELLSGENKFFVSVIIDKDNITLNKIDDNDYFKNRKKILKNNIGSDIYFYTDDNNVLNRYENDLTIIEETEIDKYILTKHKIFTLDSIPQNKIYDFNSSSISFIYDVSNKSIPINVLELEDGLFELSLEKKDVRSKKVYMIKDFDIKNIMCDSRIIPILKYLNVFEIENGKYKKINIEDYMKREDILKYIKKPSKN